MKHLHYFKTREEYEEKRWMLYRPYVAYIEDEDKIERWEDETRTIAVFKTTKENQGRLLFSENLLYWAPITDYVSEMYIDGVKLNTPIDYYNFTNSGKHIVEYKFFGNIIEQYFDDIDLESIDFGSDVTHISWLGQEGVTCPKIMLGNSQITTISDFYFDTITHYQICLPPTVKTIEPYNGFTYGNIESIIIPNVETIPQNVFGNTLLSELNIPKSLKFVGHNAFAECPSLQKINIKYLKNFQQIEGTENLLKDNNARLYFNNAPLLFGKNTNVDDGSNSGGFMSLRNNIELYYKSETEISDFVVGESYFGNNASVIEHRYDENEGIGVIIFEGEIPSMEEVQELYPNLEIIEINNI